MDSFTLGQMKKEKQLFFQPKLQYYAIAFYCMDDDQGGLTLMACNKLSSSLTTSAIENTNLMGDSGERNTYKPQHDVLQSLKANNIYKTSDIDFCLMNQISGGYVSFVIS